MSNKLGDEFKDVITGFKGIAIAKIEYLNGCIQLGIKAQVVDATLKEAEYIDESQLERIGPGINKPVKEEDESIEEEEVEERPEKPSKNQGGPQSDGPPRTRRSRKGYY